MSRLPQEFKLLVGREVGKAGWRIDEIMAIVGRDRSTGEGIPAIYSFST